MNVTFRALAPLAAYQFCYFAFIGILSPYLPLYLDSLGWSAAAIATMMVVLQGARVVAPTLWSLWAERHFARMRHLVQWAPAAAALGFLPFYVSYEPPVVLVAVGLAAFFWSGALPLFEALTLAALGPAIHRYPQVRLWGSLGFIVAVVGMGAWLEKAPLLTVRDALLLSLLVLWGVGQTLPLPVGAEPTQATPEEVKRWRWWRVPGIVPFFLATMAMSVAHAVLYTFLSLHLTLLGYGKAAVGALWALGVIAEIGLFLVLPQITLRLGFWPLFLAAFAAAAVRFVLLGWLAESLWVVVVAQVMHALTFGLYHGSAVQLINGWFGQRAPALGQALYSSLSFGFGGMVGSALAGFLWEEAGPAWAFTGAAVAAAVGGALAWSSREASRCARNASPVE